MGDEAIVIGLVIFVCCILVCAVLYFNTTPVSSPGASASDIADALNNFDPNANRIIQRGGGGGSFSSDQAYSYREYKDFKASSFASMGPGTSVNSVDDCSAKCGSTPGCRGFSYNNNVCEIFNNVNILERSKNSNVYASNDVDAVKFLHVPFKNIPVQTAPKLWEKHGSLPDFASNCHGTCKGFSMNGSDAIMYPAIIAVDSDASGDTYIDKESPVKFIREGNFLYSETPFKTMHMPASYFLTTNEPEGDASKFVFYDGHGPGFDAGLRAVDVREKQMSNVISVTSLAQCQNACVTNTWCQSFTMIGTNQCYQRNEINPQHFPRTDMNGNPCVPIRVNLGLTSFDCACGVDGALCASFNESRDGTSGTANTSYVKKQYPMSLSCPQGCSQDALCKMVTYTDDTCNHYNDNPINRVPSTTTTSVWNFKEFPR